ncbi:hypothetical protein DY000_02024322 [Brassica cretica]|uniref:Uncharacterized protein n=1 Tax=Brassica cretica TaxID=69181 RepID=A0ABQ7EEE3_BRACR|nr:hypothetical protein DY000_02024322 [Brassica cretica]
MAAASSVCGKKRQCDGDKNNRIKVTENYGDFKYARCNDHETNMGIVFRFHTVFQTCGALFTNLRGNLVSSLFYIYHISRSHCIVSRFRMLSEISRYNVDFISEIIHVGDIP